MFAALTAVKALKLESIPCARCVILIEACEESGSFDLPHYVNALADRIGTPDLVVCLDSGCGDYERMWVTTSLRGVINATLSVSTLTEGVHSGAASGIVPSSFRILRRLLSRLEDENTGQILPGGLHVEIPPDRLAFRPRPRRRSSAQGCMRTIRFTPAPCPWATMSRSCC